MMKLMGQVGPGHKLNISMKSQRNLYNNNLRVT